MGRTAEFSRGDLVEVKSPEEILQTLDADGALGNLPFMPEMVEFCGRQFRVSQRALTICISGPGWRREFKTDDVVTLDEVRCSGAAHDDCQKACLIFWREAWLRKVEARAVLPLASLAGKDRLMARLEQPKDSEIYYCQASELPKATSPLTRTGRIFKLLDAVRSKNSSLLHVFSSIFIWAFWRARKILLGQYVRGRVTPPPSPNLKLRPGELVEVKSLKAIRETLNEAGKNRGLEFSAYMHRSCGQQFRVKERIDRIILDGTGEMRQLRDTVRLDGATCGCEYMGFGMATCSRCEVAYWREAWLRRVEN